MALVGGKIIDGVGGVHDGWTVLIEGDTIKAAGPGIGMPTGTKTIRLDGQAILPGLIDMHGHMYARAHVDIVSQFDAYPLLYLAGGVTTVRDPGELNPIGVAELRDNVDAGIAIGPRIFTAGPYFDHAPSFVRWIKGTETPEEALSMFDEWKDQIDVIKVYSRIHEDQFIALQRAAESAGLPIIGHLGSLTAQRAVDLGINGLEHGLFTMTEFTGDGKEYDGLAQLDLDSPQVVHLIESLVKRKVVVCPTTVTFQLIMRWAAVMPDWMDYLTPEAQAHQSELLAKVEQPDSKRQETMRNVEATQLEFTRRLHDAGGIVVVGTDPTHPMLMPGWGMYKEMENLVDAGLTPLDAIRAATYEAAKALGVQDELGSIAPGKKADLIIVDGDPSGDIRDLWKTRTVVQGGKFYSTSELRALALGKIR